MESGKDRYRLRGIKKATSIAKGIDSTDRFTSPTIFIKHPLTLYPPALNARTIIRDITT
jgi:hypothetical protein